MCIVKTKHFEISKTQQNNETRHKRKSERTKRKLKNVTLTEKGKRFEKWQVNISLIVSSPMQV
jgi:hypothetical protein